MTKENIPLINNDIEGLNRKFFTYSQLNAKNEVIQVQFTEMPKGDIIKGWYKIGYVDSLESRWVVEVSAYNVETKEYKHKYNPIRTPENLINFDWVLESTQENMYKLLDEIKRRAFE